MFICSVSVWQRQDGRYCPATTYDISDGDALSESQFKCIEDHQCIGVSSGNCDNLESFRVCIDASQRDTYPTACEYIKPGE